MSNPELFLLHGWGLNAAIWGDQTSARSCYAPDLPGHGDQAGAATSPVLEDWLAALLAAAPPRAVWLGWSFGGLLALAAACRHPERVRALILVATTPCFVARTGWAGVDATVWTGFAQALADDYEATLQRFLVLQAGLTDRAALRDLRRVLVRRGAPAPTALAAGLQVMAGTDLRAEIPALRVPVLLLQGGHDRIVPAAAASWLGAALDTEPVWFASSGHAPFIADSPRFWDAVDGFLRGLGSCR